MKVKYVNKLWKGQFVSIRDYELEEALNEGGLEVHHDGSYRVFDLEELEKVTPNDRVFQSKTGGKSYRLVDLPWE